MARRFRVTHTYRPHSGGPEPLKIGLILSGAVALGTFEAGVAYELLRAVGRGEPLTVDLVAGSSAGALVGAMIAKSLVMGVPFEHTLPRWTEFTLRELTSAYETLDQARRRGKPVDKGILSSESVRRILQEYLVQDPVERGFQPAFPAPRVLLGMTLTNLDGLPDAVEVDDDLRFTDAVVFRFTPPVPHRLHLSPYPPAVWQRIALVGRASSAFPGAFDPDPVPWKDRIRIPGLLEEEWENSGPLERLHEQEPTLQPQMRYADGGILDEQPVERAITLLPRITGGRGEPGVQSLVYDPRRCMILIEPDPPATSVDTLRAGTPQTWFAAFTRSVRLWTLSASPHSGHRRVLAANKRQERLMLFLADLARRMREGEQLGKGPHASLARLARFDPGLAAQARRVSPAAGGLGEAPGLIDPQLFREAVRAFYRWLKDEARFRHDMEWLERLPAGRIKGVHAGMRAALQELREAYLSLEWVDPVSPGSQQAFLEEIHAELAESLGLAQPWIAQHEITPDDPRQMLKGEEIVHFGGFFSEEFLRHDFEVGRWYAHLWLKEAIVEYNPPDPPAEPPPTEDGVTWQLLWQNRGPLWRMAGRLLAATLEMAGLPYGSGGQLLIRLLTWSGVIALLHGVFLLVGAWVGWITFPPQYQQFRFWLLMGTSIFPLTFGVIVGLLVRAEIVRGGRVRRKDKQQP